MTLKAGTRTRLATASVLALVLASGVVLGMALDRHLETRDVSAEQARRSRPAGGGDWVVRGPRDRSGDSSRNPTRGPSQRGPSLLVEQVGLSEAQAAEADSIYWHYRGEMRALHEEFDQAYSTRYREIMARSREDMLAILTAEQRVVYDSILGEWQRRREERREDSAGSSRSQRGESERGPQTP